VEEGAEGGLLARELRAQALRLAREHEALLAALLLLRRGNACRRWPTVAGDGVAGLADGLILLAQALDVNL
jgi:hypothetical protein